MKPPVVGCCATTWSIVALQTPSIKWRYKKVIFNVPLSPDSTYMPNNQTEISLHRTYGGAKWGSVVEYPATYLS